MKFTVSSDTLTLLPLFFFLESCSASGSESGISFTLCLYSVESMLDRVSYTYQVGVVLQVREERNHTVMRDMFISQFHITFNPGSWQVYSVQMYHQQ